MLRRVVLPAGSLTSAPGPLELTGPLAHHLRVLRLPVGTELELTDGAGREVNAVLRDLDGQRVYLDVRGGAVERSAPDPKLIVLQGVGKGEKLDRIVRQVAELGVSGFVPVQSARAVARAENKTARLRSIAEDALRVSRGAHRMEVAEPLELSDAFDIQGDLKLVLVPGAETSMKCVLAAAERPRMVVVLVGPEGGLTPSEVQAARQVGFLEAHIGRFVLRTETAGPAAVAMLRFAFGG